MRRNNIFRICLVLSLSLHAGFILPWSFLNFFVKKDAGCQNIELTYFSGNKTLEARGNEPRDVYAKNTLQEPAKSGAPDIDRKPKAEVRTPSKNKADKEKEEAGAAEAKTAPQEQKTEVTDIETQKGAVYEKYYLDVRSKIKAAIEKNKRGLFKESEIHVRFILDRNGALRNMSLYKTSGGEAADLEQLAIKSIEEAAPFPPFSDKIKEGELQFNLPIRVIRKNVD